MTKFLAEWIPYRNSYRLFDAFNPSDTIAYLDEDDLLSCDVPFEVIL